MVEVEQEGFISGEKKAVFEFERTQNEDQTYGNKTESEKLGF